MKLYLVQHGEAVPKEEDPERPLSEKGRADVRQLAAFLEQADVSVARVLHSGKLRDELLKGEIFYSLEEAQVLIER